MKRFFDWLDAFIIRHHKCEKNMEIRYEFDHITGSCYTRCKNKPTIMVGSVMCKLCESCVSHLEDYQIIICNFNGKLKKNLTTAST